jgi:HAE1 family hydrophobic/amphiphilic exporter-1
LSWLTKMSLRNRSIVGLAILAVLLVGAYAITSLKQELIPDLTFPYLTVLTVDQGSSPADVERNITTPIEQALKTSSGIKEFDSFSNDGMSIITVQYEFGTDMKAKEAEVQQSVSGVQQMLPVTAMAPKVAALNFNSMPCRRRCHRSSSRRCWARASCPACRPSTACRRSPCRACSRCSSTSS